MPFLSIGDITIHPWLWIDALLTQSRVHVSTKEKLTEMIQITQLMTLLGQTPEM
jgi:hypothetical protein